MNEIPLIRIEVETMRQSMIHAFSRQMLRLDEMFKEAINDACQPEKVQAILTEAANKYIQEALKLETERYFLYGEGRKYISEKVKEKLDKEEWRQHPLS